jgi:uncharacterized protein (TIRG00374 family)
MILLFSQIENPLWGKRPLTLVFPASRERLKLLLAVNRKRFWIAAFIGVFILFYTFKQADLSKLAEHFQDIDRLWALLVAVTTALSYLCIAAVLHRLLEGMEYPLPFASSVRISLISCTLNYVMAFGGLSGMAAKVYLLAREKVPPSDALSISIVHAFLTNTVAVIFIYLGFFFLYNGYKMTSREIEGAMLFLLLAFVFIWITVQTIVHEAFRKRLWQFCYWLASTICSRLHHPRWLHLEKAQAFFENFNASMNLLVRNPKMLLAPATFALLDWVLMILCLKCSFLAVRCPVDTSTLLAGFSIGIFVTIFTLTPVSIGVTEGSMAGLFYLMGVDYDSALMATLIYRVGYFFLPIAASLFLFRSAFASSTQQMELDTNPERGDK